MRLSTQITPVSELKANAAEILTRLTDDRRPIVITQNGKAKAVLQDLASFEAIGETFALLKLLALGAGDAAAGRARPLSDVIAELRAEAPAP